MKRNRMLSGILLVPAFLLAMMLALTVSAHAEHRNREIPVLSYGLSVLSARTDVAFSAPVGNEIAFSADGFARGLNLSRVQYLTVHSLPRAEEGELLLGSTRLATGQTISAANLSHVTFCPALEGEMRASFTFTVNGGSIPTVCNLYLVNMPNYTPTVSMASFLSLNPVTYRDLSVQGKLSAYDPDGDNLVFEIVAYPQNGSVRLIDRSAGTYCYQPEKGYTGSDSFRYVARDLFGNYSAAATVNLRVNRSGTSVTYADTAHSPAECAAIAMTERGIMTGTQIGGQYYFHPEQTVTRAEFLVSAMNAVGMVDVPDCKQTVFADDGEIPDAMKGYVSAAYSMGYVTGTNRAGTLCFSPNDPITRAEAAVILSKLMGVSEPPVTPTFADSSGIPAWASSAVYALYHVGILPGDGGYIASTSNVTRADAARMLFAVVRYAE